MNLAYTRDRNAPTLFGIGSNYAEQRIVLRDPFSREGVAWVYVRRIVDALRNSHVSAGVVLDLDLHVRTPSCNHSKRCRGCNGDYET